MSAEIADCGTYYGAKAGLDLLLENVQDGSLPRAGTLYLLSALQEHANELRNSAATQKLLGSNPENAEWAEASLRFIVRSTAQLLGEVERREVRLQPCTGEILTNCIRQAVHNLDRWAAQEGANVLLG